MCCSPDGNRTFQTAAGRARPDRNAPYPDAAAQATGRYRRSEWRKQAPSVDVSRSIPDAHQTDSFASQSLRSFVHPAQPPKPTQNQKIKETPTPRRPAPTITAAHPRTTKRVIKLRPHSMPAARARKIATERTIPSRYAPSTYVAANSPRWSAASRRVCRATPASTRARCGTEVRDPRP